MLRKREEFYSQAVGASGGLENLRSIISDKTKCAVWFANFLGVKMRGSMRLHYREESYNLEHGITHKSCKKRRG